MLSGREPAGSAMVFGCAWACAAAVANVTRRRAWRLRAFMAPAVPSHQVLAFQWFFDRVLAVRGRVRGDLRVERLEALLDPAGQLPGRRGHAGGDAVGRCLRRAVFGHARAVEGAALFARPTR